MTGNPSQQSQPWRLRDAAAAGFVIAFLAGQTLLCLVQLTKPRPARFGWQMYSGYKNPLQYRVMRRDGTSVRVSLDRYVANPRYELDGLERIVPPIICAQDSSAAAVVLTFLDKPTTEYQCAR
jgi:hypothetical protein